MRAKRSLPRKYVSLQFAPSAHSDGVNMKVLGGIVLTFISAGALTAEPGSDQSQDVVRWFDACAGNTAQSSVLAAAMDSDCAGLAIRYCEIATKENSEDECFVMLRRRLQQEVEAILPNLAVLDPGDPFDKAHLRMRVERLKNDEPQSCPKDLSADECAAVYAAANWMYARDLDRKDR